MSSLSIDSVLWWISTQIGGSSPFSLRLLLLLAMFISIDNDSDVGFPESKVLEILSKGSCLSEELRKCITPTAARSIRGIHFISCHVVFLLESNRQGGRHTYRYSFVSKLVYPIQWSISFSFSLTYFASSVSHLCTSSAAHSCSTNTRAVSWLLFYLHYLTFCCCCCWLVPLPSFKQFSTLQ